MNLLPGFATEISTKPEHNNRDYIFINRRRPLFPNGPYITPIGFGSYRIGYSKSYAYPECEQALSLALCEGLNIIDTSTNYGFGQSELLIGKIIHKLIMEKKITRENIVIISKLGYMQGPNLELAKNLARDNLAFPEITKFGEDTWYCIHPQYIADQIERSRARLGLETIDVYLLHNPEYILKGLELAKVDVIEAKNIFYARIKQSFLALEQLVQEKKICCYGLSSNSLAVLEDEYTNISLTKILEIAKSISPDHHFRILQVPCNWLEISPIFYREKDTDTNFLMHATQNGLGIILNRPLNAMFNNGLVRLTRPQFSAEEIKNFDEKMQDGYKNWLKLATDLENIAKEQLALAPGYNEASLSQLVLSTLLWVQGISCVLCGMRKRAYVQDAQQTLKLPALASAKLILQKIYENLEFHI